MGQRLFISEDERKEILLRYSTLLEQTDSQLVQFEGKSIILYDDPSETKVYRRGNIEDIKFVKNEVPSNSRESEKNGVSFWISGNKWLLYCLTKPDQFNSFIKNDDYDLKKYNKNFVNQIKLKFPTFCKAPKADFSTIDQPNTNNIT